MYVICTKGYLSDAGIRYAYRNAFAVWFVVGLIEGEGVCGTGFLGWELWWMRKQLYARLYVCM